MSNLLPIIVVVVGFLFFNQTQNSQKEQVNLDQIKAKLAHDLAYLSQTETKVPDIKPDEIPPLANCPLCKGTKVQTHADGHKTPCPYHGTTLDAVLEEVMALSAKVVEKERLIETLQQDLIVTREQLAEIDKAHKQPQLVITQKTQPTKSSVYAQRCPCGCNHTLGTCTCRSTCPGKTILRTQLQKQAKPQPQRQWTHQEFLDSQRFSGNPPEYAAPKAPGVYTTYKTTTSVSPVRRQNYTYTMSCSGGQCFRKRMRG